jgi:hypothetical protein
MKYYELRDDVNYPERWYLGDIVEVEDSWQFTSGNKIDEILLPRELHIRIYQEGKPMDYTATEAYSIPIVSVRIKAQLDGARGLQFVPVRIEGKECGSDFFIMVVTNKLDSVDEKLSEFGKFVENDPVRPDLAGHYSWFTNLKVDKGKINSEDIFRIEKAEYYLIVSERIKAALEDIRASGLKFTEV